MSNPSRKIRTIQRFPLLIILGIILFGWLRPVPAVVQRQSRADSIEAAAATPLWPLPPKKQDVVLLADPQMAHRMQLTPQKSREIARIDSELDKRAHRLMQNALEEWQKNGGFHANTIPNFRDPYSPWGSALRVMKKIAEAKIEALLTEDEKRRWDGNTGPQADTSATQLVPATL